MNEHTPGPFNSYLAESNYQGSYTWYQAAVYDDDNREIARILSLGGEDSIAEAHANAYLMTAAPDLLEACKCVVGAMQPAGAHKLEGFPAEQLLTQLNAAIAKAEGRS